MRSSSIIEEDEGSDALSLSNVVIKTLPVNENERETDSDRSSVSLAELDSHVYELAKRRWLILGAYCLLTLSAGSSWLCFPAVSNIMQRYYKISILSVNMLSIIFGIAIILASLPFAAILEKYGLSFTLKLSGLLNLIGAGVRYFGSNPETGYWNLLIGNLFTALSVAGFLFLPGKIAVAWFGISEIGKATSICIAFDALGSGLGFLHATMMIGNHDNIELIEKDIHSFLIAQSVPAVAVFLCTLLFVKNNPKTPPNIMELQQEQEKEEYHSLIKGRKNSSDNENDRKPSLNQFQYLDLKTAIWKLLRNRQFHLIVHMQGITATIEGIYEMLLNELLIKLYPGYEKNIGMIGFIAVILGFGTNILVGLIIDKTSASRMVSILVFLMTTLCCVIWTLLLEYIHNFFALAIIFCLLMSICTAYYTIAFAHSAQVTAPISPAATGVMLVLTSQIYDTLGSFAITEILEYFGSFGVNCTAIIICSFAIILAFMIKDKVNEKPVLI